MADVDRFKQFGVKMTFKALSEKYHKTIEEVLQMQAETIYEILLMDFEEDAYRRDLQKAHEQLAKLSR